MSLTGAGWAVLPFAVLIVAGAVLAIVIYVRRERRAGFDLDEAAHFVWGHLDRNQKTRIALSHVVAVLEAEKAVEAEPVDEDALRQLVGEAANDAGAVLYEKDLDDLLRLQYEYATRKGLL